MKRRSESKYNREPHIHESWRQQRETDLFFEELTGRSVNHLHEAWELLDVDSFAGATSQQHRPLRRETDSFFEQLVGRPVSIARNTRVREIEPYTEGVARYRQQPPGKGSFQHAPLNDSNRTRRNRGINVEARWNFDKTTALALPNQKIDIVVYLHGYGYPHNDFLARKANEAGLDMVDSGGTVTVRTSRPTLALVPLGIYDPFSRNGRRIHRWRFTKLASKTAFDALVTEGLQWLELEVLNYGACALRPGNLTLMAHSGGGAYMSMLLQDGLDPAEVVCYDSTYGGSGRATPIVQWANRKITGQNAPSSALRVFYIGGTSTQAGALYIKRAVDRVLQAQGANCAALARRYRVEPTRVHHGDIPARYSSLLLNDIAANMPSTTVSASSCVAATRGRPAAVPHTSGTRELRVEEDQIPVELTPTEIIDRIRDMALDEARARRTFLSVTEVRNAIDSRASGDPVDLHMNQSVLLVQTSGTVPMVGFAIELGMLWSRTSSLLTLLERRKFRCATTGAMSLNMAVVDSMRQTWTNSNEGQAIAGLCGSAVTPCPTAHSALHGTGNAAHFIDLSRLGIRVVELAGLWGKSLVGISPQSHRARVAVKTLPTTAPASNTSFVAVRSNTTRHAHFGRETPRRVEAFVGTDTWKNLALEATPGTDYQVFKRSYWEASFHRQWGKEATIQWIKGLAQFYRDRTGGVLGVGDISHIVGEDITDHASHERGVDVDLYALEPSAAGSTFPTAFWTTVVSGTPTYRQLGTPSASSASPVYSVPGSSTAALSGTAASRAQLLYVTILAYCAATHGQLVAAVWHGARRLRTDAVTQAQAAWDATVAAGLGSTTKPGWQSNWGPGPANRAAISAPSSKFIGDGASNYGSGKSWPLHRDHVHVRLA